jgi:glutamine cyclotransferase
MRPVAGCSHGQQSSCHLLSLTLSRPIIAGCPAAGHLPQVGTFKTPLSDGWGIADDGGLLVVSDGSSTLSWLDPGDGFRSVRQVVVRSNGQDVKWLNEVCVVA